MTFLLGLWANPLARKIIIYAGIALAVLYGLRLWGNTQWSKGEAQGRLTMGRDIERQKQAEWKAKEAQIAQVAATVDAERSVITAASEQLRQDRANLSRTLSDARSAIQRERMSGYANAASVPDNRIWDDIRAVSGKLAADAR
jgi:hypothetical protein